MAHSMYILLREEIDNGFAGLAIGHGVLACYLKFKDDPDMIEWLDKSYLKRLCSLNEKEFSKAKNYDKYVLMTESSLGGEETALVFCPRPNDKWEKSFKFYRLWKGKIVSGDGPSS